MNFNKTNNINNKNINKNEDIILRKLNLKKHSSNGFMQIYRNNNAHIDTKYLTSSAVNPPNSSKVKLYNSSSVGI